MSEAERAVEDELEVLSSIYGDDFARLGSASFTITLPHPTPSVVLHISLPSSYPTAPPAVAATLSSASVARVDDEAVQAVVQRVWREAAGEVCCYQAVEAVKELLDTQRQHTADELPAAEVDGSLNAHEAEADEEVGEANEHDQTVAHYSDDEHQQPAHDTRRQRAPQQQPHAALPAGFTTGPPHTDRKSVFVAHCAPVHSGADVAQLVSYLRAHPKLSRATHNISAYRLSSSAPSGGSGGSGGGSYAEEGCDDDGEDKAGGRLLHLLRAMQCENVWVCVSRWYGGVRLGSDRFRIINNVARQQLEQQGYGVRKAVAGGHAGGGANGTVKKANKR